MYKVLRLRFKEVAMDHYETTNPTWKSIEAFEHIFEHHLFIMQLIPFGSSTLYIYLRNK